MKKILENNWHLKSLTLPFSILFMWLIVNHNFLDLGDTGKFFNVFICTFSALISSFFVEWLSVKKSDNSYVLVSVIAGLLGALIAVLFPPATFFAYGSLGVILALEIYKRKSK